ncbi:substance-P receptor-like [Symsagittifera roscoffensis]|uniref:substance-P receptor-like n=1 Tax=Symsagittifera roscoffensis TaxID=84072 RepID=UPI00307CBE12
MSSELNPTVPPFTTEQPKMTDEPTDYSADNDVKEIAEMVFWAVLYSAVVFMGFFGNVIVIWVVGMHASMHNVTNYFLVNLSISDVMYTTLNIPWYFVSNLSGEWLFGTGSKFCKIVRLVAPLSAAASTFSMTAISIDRYCAIVNPLSHQLTHSKAWAGIVAIWTLSVATAYPQFHFSETVQIEPNSTAVQCLMIFPDGLFGTYFLVTKILQSVIYLVIPGLIISSAYTAVARELWQSNSIGETQNQRQIDSKRRIVKMMITIAAVFNLSMIPMHAVLIGIGLDQSVLERYHVAIKRTWMLVTLLANSNTVYNPIIYCYMNSRFRRGFINFFRALVCKRRLEIDSVRATGGNSGHDMGRRSRGGHGASVPKNSGTSSSAAAVSRGATVLSNSCYEHSSTGPLRSMAKSSAATNASEAPVSSATHRFKNSSSLTVDACYSSTKTSKC